MKLKAITVIDDGKSQIKPGTEFERPKKEALELIDCGAAEAVVTLKVVEPEPQPDPDPDPDTKVDLSEEGDGEDLAPRRDPLTGLPTS